MNPFVLYSRQFRLFDFDFSVHPFDSEELDSNSVFDFEVVTVEDIEDILVTVENIEDILASELPEKPFPTMELID